MPFDMDAFLKDFQEQNPTLTDAELIMATLHHLWMDHPLKIETSIGLLAVTDNLALDFTDIRYIRKDKDGDFEIGFKSQLVHEYIYAGTPEHIALQATIVAMRNKPAEH